MWLRKIKAGKQKGWVITNSRKTKKNNMAQ